MKVMIIIKRIHVLTINVLLVTMSFGYCLANTTLAEIEDLFNNTILATGHKFRPTFNQSKPTVVYLSLMLLSLADVDEVHQSISSNVLLTLNWFDELRKWDPENYGGLTSIHPNPLDIWRPRLFLSNSISERDMFKDEYAPLTIYSTGQIEWLPGGIMYTSCSMKMTNFPFDTQTCTLSFTVGENFDTIQLLPGSSSVSFGHYDRNGEWVIESSEVVSSTVDGKSNVKFVLNLNRLPSFTLLSLVIPVNIISSLSSLVFIMPVKSGERVSFSITVLMSLTVYTGEITKDLPTSSESLPLLIMYLTGFLLHSGLAIIANLIVLIRHYHLSVAAKNKSNSSGAKKSDETSHKSAQISTRNCSNNTQIYDRYVATNHSDYDLRHDFSFTEKNSQNFSMYNLEKNHLFRQINLNNANSESISSRRKRTFSFERNDEMQTCFDSSFEKSDQAVIFSDDCDKPYKPDNNKVLLKLRSFCIFKYINMVDIVLFVLFFGVWLIVTVVYMTLIAFGTL